MDRLPLLAALGEQVAATSDCIKAGLRMIKANENLILLE